MNHSRPYKRIEVPQKHMASLMELNHNFILHVMNSIQNIIMNNPSMDVEQVLESCLENLMEESIIYLVMAHGLGQEFEKGKSVFSSRINKN